jgi:SynChlorMet cassette protein ScmC
MELEACRPTGCPKLIFIGCESGKDRGGEPISRLDRNVQEGLPRSGWTAHNLGLLQLWSHPYVPDVICQIGCGEGHELDIIQMWLSLYHFYQQAQDSGGLPLHAALVERNGNGVLLAGSGNAGKSTCCRRLPPSWQALCDDETLIVRDGQKRYHAHPFPTWSDYLCERSEPTWNIQRHLPLSAIFFLEQSETDEVISIGQGQAAIFIHQSATHVCQWRWINLDCEEERSLRKKLFGNAGELAKVIPAFKLRVSLNGRFWEEMEKVLH